MDKIIKGFIFDYGDVISLPQAEDEVTKILNMLNLHSKQEEFREIYHEFRREFDGGFLSGLAYWRKITTYFDLNCTKATLGELVSLDILSWIKVNPEMLALIKLIKDQGYKLALLSNMPVEIGNYIKANCEWPQLFDYLIISGEIKVCKPQFEIYEHCVKLLQLKPEECVFVDDVPQNVIQAKNYGIRGVRYETLEKLKIELKEFHITGIE